MTAKAFNSIKENTEKFIGKKVEFQYFIPSANRYAKSTGYIKAIGLHYNSECFIISERSKEHAIHFSYVTVLEDV